MKIILFWRQEQASFCNTGYRLKTAIIDAYDDYVHHDQNIYTNKKCNFLQPNFIEQNESNQETFSEKLWAKPNIDQAIYS